MKMGMARMTALTGAGEDVLNRMGQVVAMRTYSFFRESEYVHVVDLVSFDG